jgi:hypothetical protein
MADGREERDEQEWRRQMDRQEDRDDRLDPAPADPWEPERNES